VALLLTTPPGANQNQQNVIGGINNGILNSPANAPLPAQFLSLGNLSGPSLLNALTQLDGEAGTGAERAAFQLTDQFLTLMLDPFVDGRQGRLGSGGGGAISFAPEQQENLPPDIALAYAAILKKAPPPTFDQRWTAWGTAFGGSNRANGDAVIGSTNVTAQTFGFAAGMDYHVSPNTIAGFALAGAGTNWGLANALGTGRSDAAQVGAYAITYRGGRPTSPVRSPSPTTGSRPIARRWALRFQPASSARAMGRGWKAVGASACCRRSASRRMGPCRCRTSIRRPIARPTRPAVDLLSLITP
jgi:hypothetical protein